MLLNILGIAHKDRNSSTVGKQGHALPAAKLAVDIMARCMYTRHLQHRMYIFHTMQ
jgi:phage-related protein